MAERESPQAGVETWAERRIREAIERGEFDDLPGAGKPIPGLDGPYDELWWVKQKMRRENLSWLPPALAVRRAAEEALEAVERAGSEAEVRRIVAEINARIVEVVRTSSAGPPLGLMPFDVERIVGQWRQRRAQSGPAS